MKKVQPKPKKRKIDRKIDISSLTVRIGYSGTNDELDKKRWEILRSAIFPKLAK